MNEFITFASENTAYMWLAVGVLLLVGEMVVPGVYLLWIGLAAAITSGAAFLFPSWGFEGHGLVFAILSIVSIYIGRRYFYGTGNIEPDQDVNTMGSNHIGKVYVVAEDIENGRGHVQVGDSQWLAEGPDASAGTKMRVTGIEGTVLKVVLADSE